MTVQPDNGGMLSEYKKTALLVGTYIALIFLLRYIAVVVINLAVSALAETLSAELLFVMQASISAMFLQIIPSVLGALMFGYIGKNGRGLKCIYTVPKSNSRAVSNFTAVYGFAHLFNIITVIVMFLLTGSADLIQRANNVAKQSSVGPLSVLSMVILLVVIAPIFEEFIFRGVILNALRPYGNGLAIFVSGIMFGIYHGNFQQCFYAAAGGIALGYIADVTKSTVPTTIIHAMMNGVSAIMLVLVSTDSVQRYIINGSEEEIPDADMIWVAMYGIFMVCMLILIVVGLITAILKIKQIKRYKVPKVWGEVGNGKKLAMLIFTVPAVISLIMIADIYSGFSEGLIANFFGGSS